MPRFLGRFLQNHRATLTALALGIAPRLSAAALIGLLVPTTIVGHPFWKIEDKAKRRTAVTGTLNNAAIIGGLMLVRARRKR